MNTIRLLTVASLLLPATAAAQRGADSAAFVIRLGRDTTVIERVVRTQSRVVAEAVQRSPTTSVHRMEMDLDRRGEVVRSVYSVARPGEGGMVGAPSFTQTVTLEGDSATLVAVQGANTRTVRIAARNAIPIAGPFYTPYEMAIQRTLAAGRQRDSVALIPGAGTVRIPVERVGADSIALTNQFAEPMRARVDAQGRLLSLHTPMFTSVERVGWLELEPWIREFANRDATGRALGPLSPRSAARLFTRGANLWIDYSRPSVRGRPVWGGLIPFGQVWRMGANDAAHFSTDRRVRIGDIALDPGTYTLFLLPTTGGWSLIVNRRTGMSGLEHDATADVGRIPLVRRTLERPAEQFTLELRPSDTGATLQVAWGSEAGSVPIQVEP